MLAMGSVLRWALFRWRCEDRRRDQRLGEPLVRVRQDIAAGPGDADARLLHGIYAASRAAELSLRRIALTISRCSLSTCRAKSSRSASLPRLTRTACARNWLR